MKSFRESVMVGMNGVDKSCASIEKVSGYTLDAVTSLSVRAAPKIEKLLDTLVSDFLYLNRIFIERECRNEELS